MKYNRKLTEEKVNEVRLQLILGHTLKDIAKSINVSQKTIWNIDMGLAYASIPLPVLKDYPNYTVYQNGKVVSKKTNSVLSDTTNGNLRLINKNGKRVTENPSNLINRALISQK